jgi:hypothetical protein
LRVLHNASNEANDSLRRVSRETSTILGEDSGAVSITHDAYRVMAQFTVNDPT